MILLSLFLFLAGWLLFAPIILRANSSANLFRVSLPGIISARIIPGEYKIRIWLFFIPFCIDPIKLAGKSLKKEKISKKNRSKKKIDPRQFSLVRNVLSVHKLDLDIDTDDFILNAWLVPAFSAVNEYRNINISVNFVGNLYLNMDLRTRLVKIIWLMIRLK